MFETAAFIAGCLSALNERTPELAIKELVAEAVSQPSEVQTTLGPATQAGLVPLYRSEQLTVLKVLWAPGMSLYPHEHGMWAVIGIYGGQENNVFYRHTKELIAPAGGRSLEVKDTVLLGADVVHGVTNRQRVFAEAIHVYGGDFLALRATNGIPTHLKRDRLISNGRWLFSPRRTRLSRRAGRQGAER